MNPNINPAKSSLNETLFFNSLEIRHNQKPSTKKEDQFDIPSLLKEYNVTFEKLACMIGPNAIPFAGVFGLKVTNDQNRANKVIEIYNDSLGENDKKKTNND